MLLNGSISIISSVSHDSSDSAPCQDRSSTGLWVHFVFVWYMTLQLIMTSVLVSCLVDQFFRSLHLVGSGRSLGELENNDRMGATRFDRRCHRLKTPILWEVKLILFYVSGCFLVQVIIRTHSIRWMSLARWLIEATFAPVLIGTPVLATYFNQCEDYLLENDSQAMFTMAYRVKTILFVLMRYFKMHPSLGLHVYQTVFFYHFCDALQLEEIFNDRHLRCLLKRADGDL